MVAQPLFQPPLFEPEEPEGPEKLGPAIVRHIWVRQILTRTSGSLAAFDYSLNPYIGCGFACSYCYASFFQADQHKFDSWGQWIEVKANAVALIKSKRDLKGAKLMMGSATDPYQPIEAKVELTRRLVEVMSDPLRQPKLTVQTRGPLVERDFDLFLRFDDFRLGMSITTDSERVRKEFEPSCAALERRMETIARAKAAGLRTIVAICPMLPVEDPEKFARALKKLGADKYWTGYFHRADRSFAANTRDLAWQLSEKLGWSQAEYRKTAARMRAVFPKINEGY